MRLAAIDTTGFTAQEIVSRDLLLRQFAEDEEAAEFKEWEMPVNQMGGIQTTYPQLVAQLSFTTVKDYDDWIARLHAIPKAFEQVTKNMSTGVEDHRVPPKFLLEKALDQVKELAHAEAGRFAAGDAAEEVSGGDSCSRAGADQDGDAGRDRQGSAAGVSALSALSGGDVCAGGARGAGAFGAAGWGEVLRVSDSARQRRRILTAEQIHQIGLDEVKRTRPRCWRLRRSWGLPI
jgi:uncharacterized protein (DUF885 family)